MKLGHFLFYLWATMISLKPLLFLHCATHEIPSVVPCTNRSPYVLELFPQCTLTITVIEWWTFCLREFLRPKQYTTKKRTLLSLIFCAALTIARSRPLSVSASKKLYPCALVYAIGAYLGTARYPKWHFQEAKHENTQPANINFIIK